MALTFYLLDPSNYSDPKGIFSGDTGTNAPVGSLFTLNSLNGVSVTVAENILDDGGSDLASPVTVGGITYPAGREAEANYEVIFRNDATGLYHRISAINIDNDIVGIAVSKGWSTTLGNYVDQPLGLPLTLRAIDGDDLDGTPNIARFATDSNYSGIEGNDAELREDSGLIICFASDTMIDTSEGPVPAGQLAPGDLVRTVDHGLKPVRWVGARTVSRVQMQDRPGFRPVRISAGALGFGRPQQDMLVSQQHRILVDSRIARNMFGTAQVIVAAKQLAALDGIDIVDAEAVTYVHFMFDQHELVYAEGAVAESLFTGPEAIKAVGPDAQAEIFAIFPELEDHAVTGALPVPVRPIAKGKDGRKMAQRMKKQGRFPLEIERPEAVA